MALIELQVKGKRIEQLFETTNGLRHPITRLGPGSRIFHKMYMSTPWGFVIQWINKANIERVHVKKIPSWAR